MKQETIPLPFEGESQINLFRKKEVRKVFHEKEWWFSVIDVIEALTDSTKPRDYWYAMKTRVKKEEGVELSKICRQLKLESSDGKKYETDCANIEGIFRLIQSIPSGKAEPFKRWLSKVGFERLQEVQNPELAVKRAITLYRAKGYNDEWIEARIRNKASRELLTGEWGRRGMQVYIGLLTDAISVGTFGISTTEHKNIKKLKGQSLRDNMTPIELTLTTLGEQATHEIMKVTNPNDLKSHMNVASQGGRIAGNARTNIERAIGKSVISPENYLTTKQIELNSEKNKEFNEIIKKLLNTGDKISKKI